MSDIIPREGELLAPAREFGERLPGTPLLLGAVPDQFTPRREGA